MANYRQQRHRPIAALSTLLDSAATPCDGVTAPGPGESTHPQDSERSPSVFPPSLLLGPCLHRWHHPLLCRLADREGGQDMGSTKHGFIHSIRPSALPPPYQLAIEDAEFQLTVLDDGAPHGHDAGCAIAPPTWFSVALTAPTRKRYLYLVQKETDTGLIVVI